LQMFPEHNNNHSSIITLHSLSVNKSCFKFRSTVTVPQSDSFCTAAALTARSQHYCSRSQSKTTTSPAS
jgi:hypothetical protein